MPPGQASLQLGESWVVEGEDDNLEEEMKKEDPDYMEPRETPPLEPTPQRKRRAKRSPTARSPEPELVMPSLDTNSLDGSWSHPSARATRRSNPMIPVPEPRETRRRTTTRHLDSSSSPGRGNGPRSGISPEKRNSPKHRGEKSISAKATTGEAADGDLIPEIVTEHLTAMLLWSTDVVGKAFRVLKTQVSYILAAWLLFGLGIVARNLITSSIYSSLSPICRIPGTSLFNLPFCPTGSDNKPPPIVEFDQLMTMQSKFEEVLEETARSVGLPMELKRGETSLRDLRQLVKYSNIQSK
jgi:hypothetical protein